jgi:hypothetical protein
LKVSWLIAFFSGFSFENFFASPLRLEIERNNFGEKFPLCQLKVFTFCRDSSIKCERKKIEALKLQFDDEKPAKNCEIEFLFLVFSYFETATLFT